MSEKPQWMIDLDDPQKLVPIYINPKTLKNLRFTLQHVTKDNPNMSLSDAISKLCNDWVVGDNLRMAVEDGRLIRKHEG